MRKRSISASLVEKKHGDLLPCPHEQPSMKIRIRVNQSMDLSPCAHRDLTLAGRSLRWQGLDLKRSTERYTCNACGKPIVRTLKTSLSYLEGPHRQVTETSPFGRGN